MYREFAFTPIERQICLFHSVRPSYIPSHEDRALWRTFNTIKFKITGLDFLPDSDDETIVPQEAIKWIVLGWYESFASPERFAIAFKFGNIERDLLQWLRIPAMNLEDFGCPSFHCIPPAERRAFTENVLSCGQHRFAGERANDHCPIRETTFYRNWINLKCVDANDIKTDVSTQNDDDDDDADGDDDVDNCYVVDNNENENTRMEFSWC